MVNRSYERPHVSTAQCSATRILWSQRRESQWIFIAAAIKISSVSTVSSRSWSSVSLHPHYQPMSVRSARKIRNTYKPPPKTMRRKKLIVYIHAGAWSSHRCIYRSNDRRHRRNRWLLAEASTDSNGIGQKWVSETCNQSNRASCPKSDLTQLSYSCNCMHIYCYLVAVYMARHETSVCILCAEYKRRLLVMNVTCRRVVLPLPLETPSRRKRLLRCLLT